MMRPGTGAAENDLLSGNPEGATGMQAGGGGSVRSVPLRVGHIVSGDRWAGAEVQVATLLAALARIDDVSVSAIVLNPGRLVEELRSSGIDVLVVPESEHGFGPILRRVVGFVHQGGFHILHSHRYKENLLASIAGWRCGTVVIHTQHGLPEPFTGLRYLKQRLIMRLDRVLTRVATDRVISVSHEMHGRLAPTIGEERLVTIPNGLNCRNVHSKLTQREAKARLGFGPDDVLVGTAARIEPVKRLDLLIAAAKHLAQHEPKVRVVIAGEGSDLSRLRSLASSSAVGNRICFLGHRDDVHDVLRALDVFVMCSDHEGLPMALLEALYLGVPVVARAVGGVTEVLEGGTCGVLVSSADPKSLAEACMRVLSDSDLRSNLQRRGPECVLRDYSIEANAAKVATLYRSMAGRR